MTISCPDCNFTGATILPTGERKCASCGRVWHQPYSYPIPPTGALPQARSANKAAGLVVLGVVVALVLIGAVIAVVIEESGEFDDGIPTPPFSVKAEVYAKDEPPAKAKPEPAKLLRAELGPNTANSVNIVHAWWLVEYKNTGEATISYPKIKMTVTGAGETFEKDFTSSVYALPPRYSAWILCFAPPEYADGKATFEIVNLKEKTRFQETYVPLKGTNYKVQPNANPDFKDRPTLSGTLLNDKPHAMTIGYIIIIGLDEDDKPCAYVGGFTKERELPVEGQVDFSLSAGTYTVRTPKRWIIHAWGFYKE